MSPVARERWVYALVLFLHSLLRWVVLLGLVGRAGLGLQGMSSGREPDKTDKIVGIVALASMDTQLLLGVVLYLISPITKAAMGDMGAAMHDPVERFFAVEHATIMIVAVVAAHVGQVLSRRAQDAVRKHRAAAMFALVTLFFVLLGVPWPFRAVGRPWLSLPF